MSACIVVIPTYNESENVRALARSVLAHLETELIFVDDNSPDGTGAILDQLAAENSAIHVIHRARKFGFASAYRAGFEFALERNFDIIIQMDSDFSHDPDHLRTLRAKMEEFDLVIGSKYVNGGSVVGLHGWRKALSSYGNRYVRFVLGLRDSRFRLYDTTSGYMAWRAPLLRSVQHMPVLSQGYGFLIELKWQAVGRGAQIIEIPITFVDRVAGRSKLSPHIILEAVQLPFRVARLARKGQNA